MKFLETTRAVRAMLEIMNGPYSPYFEKALQDTSKAQNFALTMLKMGYQVDQSEIAHLATSRLETNTDTLDYIIRNIRNDVLSGNKTYEQALADVKEGLGVKDE